MESRAEVVAEICCIHACHLSVCYLPAWHAHGTRLLVWRRVAAGSRRVLLCAWHATAACRRTRCSACMLERAGTLRGCASTCMLLALVPAVLCWSMLSMLCVLAGAQPGSTLYVLLRAVLCCAAPRLLGPSQRGLAPASKSSVALEAPRRSHDQRAACWLHSLGRLVARVLAGGCGIGAQP